ncbi:MAG: MFS transporter [Acidimicrobiales bacterium]|nr:MFS transporter [Acidimicrobiales bacterium]
MSTTEPDPTRPPGAAVPPEEEAAGLVDDERPYTPGTARAALAHRDFRIVWIGAFASNIGTWMQNVTLGAWAYELTRSPTFVGVLIFAQLGPMLLLSLVGGALADAVDRRRLLIALQLEQLLFAGVLAALAAAGSPPKAAIVATVAAIGVGNALNAPAWQAMVPSLVGRKDLPGAISLNSTQMNASRVVGPALGGVIYPLAGAAGVFAINAGTYVFVVIALLAVRVPAAVHHAGGPGGMRRLLGGFAVARADALVRRILVTLTVFSFFCLPFIGQFPVLAAENLGLNPRSLAYGLLYACFGLGAVSGALSVGTVLAGADRHRLVRRALAGFAVALAGYALLRSPALAYPVIVLVGFTYFAAITSLSTVLQQHLHDRVRGRVMALWMMGFGGTVPLGNLVAGPLVDVVGITAIVLAGAVVAAALAWWCDLDAAARAAPAMAG